MELTTLTQAGELVFAHSEEDTHGAVVGDAHDRSTRTDELTLMRVDLGDDAVDGSDERTFLEVSVDLGDSTCSALDESLSSPLVLTLSTVHRHVVLAASSTLGSAHSVELSGGFVVLLCGEDAFLVQTLDTCEALFCYLETCFGLLPKFVGSFLLLPACASLCLLALGFGSRLSGLGLLELSEDFGRIDAYKGVATMYALAFADEELSDTTWDLARDAYFIDLYLAGDDILLLTEEDEAREG